MKMKLFVLILSCMGLISCSSSAPVTNYYQLSPVAVAEKAVSTTAKNKAPRLYIEPVQVASYLNGRGLVLQLSDVELEMARQHVWAEPLQQQLQRQIRDLLSRPTTGFTLVSQPDSQTMKLQLQIDRFHAIESTGEAVVGGFFQLHQNGEPFPSHSFHVLVPLEKDGYAGMVEALSVALAQVAEQISTSIKGKLPSA